MMLYFLSLRNYPPILFTFFLVSIVAVGFVGSVDDGPPHDSVSGDYVLDSPNFPQEKPLPPPSEEQCKQVTQNVDPNMKLDVPEFIRKYNYTLETHRVKTEDGFFLKVFRITGSPLSPPAPGKVPVFLNHGLAGSAWSWFFLPGNGSLAFKLANEGFDVFIGNARGSAYSNEHEKYNPSQDEYWDFSYHELGYYDVPAAIDYIVNITGFSSIYYIGYSLGTTEYLVAMSDRPDYNDKIRTGFLLATAGFMTNMRCVALRTGIQSYSAIDLLRKANGNTVDAAKLKGLTQVLGNPCTVTSGCSMCDLLVSQLFGFNPNQNDVLDAQFFNAKYFTTTATKVFSHLHQNMINGAFNKYDYGLENLNVAKYGVKTPPDYKLNMIYAPTVSYWGFSDTATVPEDVKKTFSKFASGVLKENNRVGIRSFTHLDFIIAKDVEKYVTNRIVWTMKTDKYYEKPPGT